MDLTVHLLTVLRKIESRDLPKNICLENIRYVSCCNPFIHGKPLNVCVHLHLLLHLALDIYLHGLYCIPAQALICRND